MNEERGRRTNERGGVSGLVVDLLVVIIILLVLLLLQLGFFSRFFGPSQLQAPRASLSRKPRRTNLINSSKLHKISDLSSSKDRLEVHLLLLGSL
jgi:hypothetical protein